jgi:hypothetical protein
MHFLYLQLGQAGQRSVSKWNKKRMAIAPVICFEIEKNIVIASNDRPSTIQIHTQLLTERA